MSKTKGKLIYRKSKNKDDKEEEAKNKGDEMKKG
jgi:hypothetical protein